MKSTEDTQNALARLHQEVDLNISDPHPALKKLYFKACQALDSARHEFDMLNDYKQRLNKE